MHRNNKNRHEQWEKAYSNLSGLKYLVSNPRVAVGFWEEVLTGNFFEIGHNVLGGGMYIIGQNIEHKTEHKLFPIGGDYGLMSVTCDHAQTDCRWDKKEAFFLRRFNLMRFTVIGKDSIILRRIPDPESFLIIWGILLGVSLLIAKSFFHWHF